MTDNIIKLIAVLIPCVILIVSIIGITCLWIIPEKSITKGLKKWWYES